ncbi:MAG: RnfABCDGE type electron transport complex subunit D, partial [Rectinema sp.]|nr:RnfABCDGE type electron transport complex subunit D [Rectinema sp.]
LALMRTGQKVPLLNLLFGLKTGALGEGMVVLILLAAAYLILTKTASWKIMLSTVAGGLLATLVILLSGAKKALPVESLLAGSFLFMTVFMATDPVSAPKRPLSHWFYGLIIGVTAVVIRTFSAFPEGTSFAILFGNTFAGLIDTAVDSVQAGAKEKKERAAENIAQKAPKAGSHGSGSAHAAQGSGSGAAPGGAP